jgi:hypothetical protein
MYTYPLILLVTPCLWSKQSGGFCVQADETAQNMGSHIYGSTYPTQIAPQYCFISLLLLLLLLLLPLLHSILIYIYMIFFENVSCIY